jgi:2-polyprenyl-3-methyl-5-hydroxy-6-metoxy-1,4-benzoquinol methylase
VRTLTPDEATLADCEGPAGRQVSRRVKLPRRRTSACPGCGGARWSPGEIDVPDAKYRVPGLWSFLRCADCGLVYLAETLADPAQGYPSAYSQHRRPGQVRLDRRWSPTRDVRSAFLELQGYGQLPPLVLPRPLARLALAVPEVRLRAAYGVLLVPPVRAGGALLDVGCGNGRLLTVMRTLGWRVHGIEPDERSAEIARRSSGARIDPELDEELYPPAYFDVITMNHVLEHVADPVTLLRHCFRLCRPGGLIGIVVPNWRALGHRLFRRDWYALEPPRHAVMYEPATLGRTLERAGFRVESVRTTSVREWAVAWRKSWGFKTGRHSPRPLLAAWAALTALAGVVADDAGEEVFAWARRP